MHSRAVARAPGSVGNVGPGLDLLGLAVTGAADEVTLELASERGIVVIDSGHPDLPTNPLLHASAIGAAAVCRAAGVEPCFTLSLRKRLPLAGGQGGSAASAVAGAVAANHLIDAGLDTFALLTCALEAESRVAGHHADNLAPSLIGGLVLVRSVDPIDVVSVPVPDIRVVLVAPSQRLATRDARAVLPAEVSRAVAIAQAGAVAAMVLAACSGDGAGFGRAIVDRIAEPARAPLMPGFLAAKAAALAAGAFGASISGAGPTAFAIVADDSSGERVKEAMITAYANAGLMATGRVAAVDRAGATVHA